MDDSTERVDVFAGVQARTSVDHALRAVQQNFTQLSTAADGKASIVIGSTLVMLSVLVGTVDSGEAPVAAYVMAGFTLLACLFALLGVLPRVTSWGRGERNPVRLADPFFFGDFDTITEENYLRVMADVLAEDTNLYRTIALDIYRQGCVLRRKYRYLRYSYQILFVGLVAASAALTIEYLLL